MPALPTVLLRHNSPQGTHYDWLLTNPADPTGRLWTARCPYRSSEWAEHESFDIEALPPHRREYLVFEGNIGGGRGTVARVDEGAFEPIEWSDRQIILDLVLRGFRGRAVLRLIDGSHWRAAFSPPPTMK